MAWTERTLPNNETIRVVPPVVENPLADKEEYRRLKKIFADMPPFIRLTSRRARKTLAMYENHKQRFTEQLRNNLTFKFVMMVAGLTNEPMQKYWKGDSADPFSDRNQQSTNTKICKEDLAILLKRARENAFADLHQFCGEIRAMPMFRSRKDKPQASLDIFESQINDFVFSDEDDEYPNIDGEDEDDYQQEEDDDDYIPEEEVEDPLDVEEEPIEANVKYIYNMSDEEFGDFISNFKERVKNSTEPDTIERYILGRKAFHDATSEDGGLPAHSHFRGQETRTSTGTRQYYGDEYDDESTTGDIPLSELFPYDDYGQLPEDSTRMDERGQGYFRRDVNHSVDRIFDKQTANAEGYDHEDTYVTLKRTNWWQWSKNVPIVRWESERPEYWFQRYVARWLTREANTLGAEEKTQNPEFNFNDLEEFKNRYQGLFNNLKKKSINGKWIRDLSGLRLSKFIRDPNALDPLTGKRIMIWSKAKAFDDCTEVCEVPLDFVKPLFEERFAYWKHELVLGEYEKKAMYVADQWLQKTPWAIGKIYLQPTMFAHMQEAHIAVTSRYKKFSHLRIDDWFNSEQQRYFFAKLTALCIRTTAVLSNKRYGLDKAYMRLNLEKKRIMYAIGKLEPPQRTRTTVAFPRATARERDAWAAYGAARQRGDVAAAANSLSDMNMRHVPSGGSVLRDL